AREASLRLRWRNISAATPSVPGNRIGDTLPHGGCKRRSVYSNWTANYPTSWQADRSPAIWPSNWSWHGCADRIRGCTPRRPSSTPTSSPLTRAWRMPWIRGTVTTPTAPPPEPREDAAQVDPKGRDRWRQQALTWLRADLDLWAKQAQNNNPKVRALVATTLKRWWSDPDLASLRVMSDLVKLPVEAGQTCIKLWTGVETVLKRANTSQARWVW